MSYDLHIVRTEDWTDSASKPITKPEVDALIATDSELAWSTTDFVDMADETGAAIRYYMITWRGRSCGFWWYRDQIQCSNPDEAQTAKLMQMARELNAHAVGDDGETYPLDEGTSPSFNPPAPPPPKSWPLWKRLVIAFLFGCVLLGLRILIFGK